MRTLYKTWLLLTALGFTAFLSVWADCKVDTFEVVMATALSSRINRVGDPVEAVLKEPLIVAETDLLPAGTVLKGKVAAIKRASGGKPGQFQVVFNRTAGYDGYPLPFAGMVNTSDGWLHQQDANTAIWQLAPNRSTRLLNQKIMQRLGTDRTVWAQILGINSSFIPDPSTDTFMQDYNRHDVLVGTGDLLQLRTGCR
ncbi:MAG TPA: hypothetical protein V6C52_09160 [Coleofasciculaceae cyanobacterium]|jgi:hypothetical protein